MKKYVFISMSIAGIGGAEQYLYNKASFLEKIGYQVFVFSSLKRKILIKDLEKYHSNIISALMYSPIYFSNREISKTVNKIANIINYKITDEIIIETTSIDAAKWGEIIAARLNCIHFTFNLQEKHNYTINERDFLRFLYEKKAIAGIIKDSINLMLGSDYSITDSCVFNAICSNVVMDVPDHYSQELQDYDLVIGSIGRLEKEYVPHVA